MSYEHLWGVMPSTERATISSAPESIVRPILTVVPDAPIAFEPEPLPPKGGSTREAKKNCLGREVRHECLDYALAHDERFGIWGGLSERERRRLKRGII